MMEPVYKQMGLSSNVVYLRPLDPKNLPSDVREELDLSQKIYGVFHEDGTQIALIDDVKLAHDLAEEHRFNLHTVH